MGNTRPFHILQRIVHRTFVIEIVQLPVKPVQYLRRQRLTLLIQLMGLALKFSKQGLTVHGRAEPFQKMIQDICPATGILLRFQQIFGQQHLIDRGGHLRHRKIRVHAVAQFVGQRKSVFQRTGKIHQHIGVHAVDAAGKCTCGLALVFIYVDPALVKRALQQRMILLAQRRRGGKDQFPGLFKRQVQVDIFYHGTIEIVHIQLG